MCNSASLCGGAPNYLFSHFETSKRNFRVISDPYRMVTTNPAKRVYRNGTASLHRTHSGVTPELMLTLGFIDEQQHERLYRAKSAVIHKAPRRIPPAPFRSAVHKKRVSLQFIKALIQLGKTTALTCGSALSTGCATFVERGSALIALPQRAAAGTMQSSFAQIRRIGRAAISRPKIPKLRISATLVPSGIGAAIAMALLVFAPRVPSPVKASVPQRFSVPAPRPMLALPKPVDATVARLGTTMTAEATGVSKLPRIVSHALAVNAVKQAAHARELAAIPSLDPTHGGEVTSTFGYRSYPAAEFHRGIDLAEPTGHPVDVSADGIVTFAGWAGGFGNKIEVDHGNGYATWYGHLSHIDVSVGQHVSRGSLIGEVGETGYATGPHLHYQIMLKGAAIDPAPYLAGVPGTVLASVKTR